MAVTSGFFNSLNHDRRYDALDFSQQFDGLIADGVFDTIMDKLMVKPGTGMNVIVCSGRAWFNHTWTYNDADLVLPIDPASIGNNRIDAVVLKVDHTETVRANSIEVIKGTPAAEPTKPELVDTTEIFYHPLAWILISSTASEITASDIENAVGTSATPFVTGIVDHISIDELLNQWRSQFADWGDNRESEFETWFSHLQNELDANQAANLQRQIDEIVEQEFKDRYSLCSRSTHYTRDDNGRITGWIATGDGITMTVTISETDTSKVFTYNITDGTTTWTKTATVTGDDLVEEYRRVGV